MILAIESSCDDSALALMDRRGRLLFHERIEQGEAHAPHGGVVPELASRLHARNLPRLLESIADRLEAVEAIAVTHEPGLTVALAEGVVMAQAVALALKKPLIGVHHLRGHLYSLFLEREPVFPFSALIVSGGHTMIVESTAWDQHQEVATTLDDSMGEAFDKVAKMLDLGYPGGPAIEQLAKQGDADRFDLPLPLRQKSRLAFSYSGLKNSMRLLIEKQGRVDAQSRADLAAAFQKKAIAHLIQKSETYLKTARPKRLGVVGGVSANAALRTALEALCRRYGCELLLAPLAYCSDNAAMIARAGLEDLRHGRFIQPAEITIRSRSAIY